MQAKTYPGFFITLEGPEGCGKSTQSTILTHDLKENGSELILTREPGGTRISDEIRKILLNNIFKDIRPITELLLFAAGRAQHMEEKIIPNLEKGKIVISDRFTDSTIAYQGYGRGFDLEKINFLNTIATKGIKPDLTLLLDIDIGKGLLRAMQLHKEEVPGKGDRFETEEIDFHQRVKNGFLQLMKENPERIVYIDANGTIEEISNTVKKIVLTKLQER